MKTPGRQASGERRNGKRFAANSEALRGSAHTE